MKGKHILVVDDEPDIRNLVGEILEDEGYQVSTAEDAESARSSRRHRRPDLVLLDIWMPGTDGIELLKEWSDGAALDVPVIMMSGHGTVETAVEATRLGAYDFIEKPLSIAKLLVTVNRALESAALQSENVGLRQRAAISDEPIGETPAIVELRAQARRIAEHKTPVLITGESGSGKETIARYLHKHSSRASAPFIVVGVGGLARENPDAEIFGIEDGERVTFGSLENANHGTLFLKDIADMDRNTQARLLGAIENGSFLRVGGREPVEIDVRIIAATSRQLPAEVAEGRFRDDLYYQLNVVPLKVPPVRDRDGDIRLLLDNFLNHYVEQEGLPRREFSSGAAARLAAYEWPGNVRELKNLVQRLLILGSGSVIETGELSGALGVRPAAAGEGMLPGFDLPLREAREKFEKAYLEHQLKELGGSVSKVAERVGIERTHLYRKLRGLGIDAKQIKEAVRG